MAGRVKIGSGVRGQGSGVRGQGSGIAFQHVSLHALFPSIVTSLQ